MSHRVGYIDAMRGLTMILVVYSHIQFFAYGMILSHSFNSFFILFRMPLFFFISGWVLYKKTRIWDKKTMLSFLSNKFKVQIVSTLIFFSLYVKLFRIDLYDAVGLTKEGYWFTYTLFYFYSFYVISILFSKLTKHKYEDIIVIIMSLIFLSIYFITKLDTNTSHTRVYEIIGIPQWKYYIFFVFGVFVKKYFVSFIYLMNNAYLKALIVGSFILLYIFIGNLSFSYFNTIKFFIFGFLGIVIVLNIFRQSEIFFDGDTFVSRSMKYIGTHTLDIYLLHFFFVPRGLQALGSFFESNPNHIIEFFVSLIFAFMVISICLIASRIIRTSSILAHYLFGVK